jgi:hypothetical protein
MFKFTSTDIIAIIVLVACFLLIANGIDSFVTAAASVVIGYYFGRRKAAEDRIGETTENPEDTQ